MYCPTSSENGVCAVGGLTLSREEPKAPFDRDERLKDPRSISKKLLLVFSIVFICSSPVSGFGYSGVMDSDSAGVLYRFFGPAWPPGDDTLNAGILEKGTYFSVSFRVFVKKFNFNSLFTPLFTWGIYRASGCLKAELRCNASI